jgi:hypothetical protein
MFRHGRSVSRALLLLHRTGVAQVQRKQQLEIMRPQVFALSTQLKSSGAGDTKIKVSIIKLSHTPHLQVLLD